MVGFVKGLGKFQNVKVCTTCTAYNEPKMGDTYVIILGQVLFFVSSLDTSLVLPNQMRENGCVTDNSPKQFTKGK